MGRSVRREVRGSEASGAGLVVLVDGCGGEKRYGEVVWFRSGCTWGGVGRLSGRGWIGTQGSGLQSRWCGSGEGLGGGVELWNVEGERLEKGCPLRVEEKLLLKLHVVGVGVELPVVGFDNVVDEVLQLQDWKVRRMVAGTVEGIVEKVVGVW